MINNKGMPRIEGGEGIKMPNVYVKRVSQFFIQVSKMYQTRPFKMHTCVTVDGLFFWFSFIKPVLPSFHCFFFLFYSLFWMGKGVGN